MLSFLLSADIGLWIKENLFWVIVIAAVVLIVLLVAIVVGTTSSRAKKARAKQAAEAAVPPAETPEAAAEASSANRETTTAQPSEPVSQVANEEASAAIAAREEEVAAEPGVDPAVETADRTEQSEEKDEAAAGAAIADVAEVDDRKEIAVQQEAPAPAVQKTAPVPAVKAGAEKPVVQTEKTAKSEEKPAEKKQPAKKPVKKQTEKKEIAEVAADVKPAAKKTDKKAEERKGYTGKWVIVKQSDSEFVAHLYASNGALMLTSEVYSTEKGAQGGIETIKKNVGSGNFEIHCDKNKNYYYKLKSASNKLLCVGEIYGNRAACESSIESVKKFCESAVLAPELQEALTIPYEAPQQEPEIPAGKQYRGKWRILPNEDMFSAYLYASNGELLLVSESYTQPSGAKTAMQNIKKNAAENHFIIDKDKSGRYYYKLRNAQKSVLCVGEAYDNLQGCTSAIESVKRFCKSAVLVEEEENKD